MVPHCAWHSHPPNPLARRDVPLARMARLTLTALFNTISPCSFSRVAWSILYCAQPSHPPTHWHAETCD